MKPTADRLVDAYLKRLERELADLPRGRRRELVGEIADHIAEARAALPHEGEAEIRTLLDQVGDPADIADEARERFEVRPRRRGVTEIVTLILLLVGGFVFVVGWFVGLVLLWVSDAWTTREKLVGTLLVPGAPARIPDVLWRNRHVRGWLLRRRGPGNGPVCGGLHRRPVNGCANFVADSVCRLHRGPVLHDGLPRPANAA
jgi:hypothetical protein